MYSGHRPPSSLRKPALIEKILKLQVDLLSNGEAHIEEPEDLSDEKIQSRSAEAILGDLREASLESWDEAGMLERF